MLALSTAWPNQRWAGTGCGTKRDPFTIALGAPCAFWPPTYSPTDAIPRTVAEGHGAFANAFALALDAVAN